MNSLPWKSSLWLLCCLSALLSCRSAKPVPHSQHTTVSQKDSVSSRLVPVDTLQVVRGKEQVSLSTVLDQLGEEPLVRREGSTTLSLSRQGNTLQAKCETEELKVALTLYKEVIEHFMQRETLTRQTDIVTEQKMPGWAKPFMYLGIAVTLLLFTVAVLYGLRLMRKGPF